MSFLNSLDISATGMTAQRLRMDIISQNVANVNTTRDAKGNPYRRKVVILKEQDITAFSNVLLMQQGTVANGVKATRIVEDTSTAMRKAYDPAHPDADEAGYVTYPNVNTVTEMTNLIDATRAYEANVTAFNSLKAMAQKALELGK